MILLLTGCSYVIVPRGYFKKLTQLQSDSLNCVQLSCRKVYVQEDTFLTRVYSKRPDRKVKGYSYIFLYQNNLMATVSTPFPVNDVLLFISREELLDSIRSGFFNRDRRHENISWDYYEIKGDKLIEYWFDYSISSGTNALTPVFRKKSNYIIRDNKLIYEGLYNPTSDYSGSDQIIYYPVEITVKPDSSKSSLMMMYNKYLKTGIRRHYPIGATKRTDVYDIK